MTPSCVGTLQFVGYWKTSDKVPFGVGIGAQLHNKDKEEKLWSDRITRP